MTLGLSLPDFFYIIRWWLIIFIIGVSFFPFVSRLFSHLPDKGYAFSKIIGIGITTYVVFTLGVLHLIAFTPVNIILILILVTLSSLLLPRKRDETPFLHIIKNNLLLLIFEEVAFLILLIIWAVVRSYQPDIHGLEKFMDFGFINSALRSTYFPPQDMWFASHTINYYYFGHLITALLTKISGIPSFISYNLMVATIFALCVIESFSIVLMLFHSSAFETHIRSTKKAVTSIAAGMLGATLIALGGSVHALYSFFKPYQNDNPIPFWSLNFSPLTFPNMYWYPNATRFIHNTIHEFPLYSFVVSDLHGHVLSIPIVLCLIALVMQQFVSGKKLSIFQSIFYGFFISLAYMTNAWDGAIYILLLGISLLVFENAQSKSPLRIIYLVWKPLVIIVVGLIIFSLPFSLSFKPFVSGIGVLCAPSFLTSIGKLGPFLFEPNHCLRSPLWQLLILYGFFYIWIFYFIIQKIKNKSVNLLEKGVMVLIITSSILIIIPEFIYMKDIYPAHYRANTMFKLGYQAYMMLSLSCGYIIIKSISNFPNVLKTHHAYVYKISSILIFFLGLVSLFLVLLYPYFAIHSYYDNLKSYRGLDGVAYLKLIHPHDYDAIVWLQENISNQPVILEAQGDSYTDYARISANTGLPTVLGWLVHEWLWRGDYSIPVPRVEEIKTLYETPNTSDARKIIEKHRIKLIYIGGLEKEKYLNLSEEKFKTLGKIIYENAEVRIYELY